MYTSLSVILDNVNRKEINANIRKGKCSRTGRENPWDATLKEPVPRLIRTLVCDWAKKYFLCPIRSQACIVLPSWPSYTKEFTSTVSSPPQKKISLARAGEFLREEVSVNSKWAPKVYSTSFIRSSCITEEKHLTTNLQTIKGEKMSPARACMTIKYAEQT